MDIFLFFVVETWGGFDVAEGILDDPPLQDGRIGHADTQAAELSAGQFTAFHLGREVIEFVDDGGLVGFAQCRVIDPGDELFAKGSGGAGALVAREHKGHVGYSDAYEHHRNDGDNQASWS